MRSEGIELYEEANDVFYELGPTFTATQAIEAGIHPRTLYQMRDEGLIVQLARGLYCLPKNVPANFDIAVVTQKYPKAVICLISALSFHELTTQIPHAVSIALPKGTATPKLKYPPINVHRFSDKAYSEGIETYTIDKMKVRIYSIEKTVADCFKFRNKLGMDIVLEALKLYKARKDFNVTKLMKYANICRVEKIMKPYLEMTV
jgi:predicted transcriptional regulator of viral defense system